MNKLNSRARTVLLGTTILAGAVAVLAPAIAQEQMETVTVTGIRASLQNAQTIKQNADQVVDSITAVDIGALPDNSVAEALQRVPGIQITRTDQPNDPLRWAGYGNGVFIRGLSWVKSLTNGEEVFGAENGRTISFADVSADLMAGVDVYKNPSAKLIEGGVGGVVDLKTRKPFDFDGRKIALSGSLDYGMIADHPGESINALVSDRFGTRVGEIGVLISASYQNLVSANNIATTDPYTDQWKSGGWPNPTYSTPGYQYPRGFTTSFGMIGYRHMDWKQPRVSLDTTLQWRPTDTLEVTLIGLFTKAEPQSGEHNVAWVVPVTNGTVSVASANGGGGDAIGTISNLTSGDQASATASMASYGYDANGYLNKGTIYNAQSNSTYANYFDTRWDVRHHTNKTLELKIKYNPTNNLEVNVDASYIDSRATMSSMTVYNMIKNSAFSQSSNYSGHASFYPNAPAVGFSFDLTDGSPSFSYDASGKSVLADQSSYLWAANMDHYENNYALAYVARTDATYTFDGQGLFGWVKSVDAGFRAALKSSATRNSGWNWGRSGMETWSMGNCGRRSDYGGNFVDPSVCAATVGDFSTWNSDNTHLYNFPTFFGQSVPSVWEPKLSWMQDPYKVWHDVQPMQNALSALKYGYDSTGANPTDNVGTGQWIPAIVRSGTCTGVAYLCENVYKKGTENIQREDTIAGYAVVNFASDTFLPGLEAPVDGNIGVRIVNTMYDSGPGALTLPNVTNCTGSGAPLAGSDRANACTFVGTDNNSTTTYAGITTNKIHALPSANFRAHLSDTLQFRLGYSQGLVRPDLERMRNYTSLGYAWAGGTTPHSNDSFASSNALTGNGSNPYLKPTYSQNYDLSLEWFFAPTGNVALGLFYKNISNYIISRATA
jgi:TonB-dependent receptor